MNVSVKEVHLSSLTTPIFYTNFEDLDDWYIASNVGSVLGYKKPRNAINEHVSQCNKRSVFIDDFIYANRSKTVNTLHVFINKSGLIELIVKSHLLTQDAKSRILIDLNLDSKLILYSRKEVEFFDLLQKIINYQIKRQYRVGDYILDGYIPEYNLAIEYDEIYHKSSKQILLDINRESYVKSVLRCDFIRLSEIYTAKKNVEIVLQYISKL